MEPQLEGCGKDVRLPVVVDGQVASMEPQLEGCGKRTLLRPVLSHLSCFNGAAT